MSALHASKGIVKSARLPVSDILVGEVFRKTAQNLFWVRTEGVQEKATVKERCEDGEHCERSPEPKPELKPEHGEEEKREEIDEYTETTINDILGERVKILDIQEVEEGDFDGSDLKIEGIGKIRTYSKVLGGQIQHLKDGGKLPAIGKVEKRQSGKSGRSYFNFSSSSFMQEQEQAPKIKPFNRQEINRQIEAEIEKAINRQIEARTLADEEAEIKEFMDY